MSDNKEIRWKLRFKSFIQVFAELEKELTIKEPDFAQQAGIVKLFELSFELAWKVLKDYLEFDQKLFEIRTPRAVMQTAIQTGVLEENDGYDWLDALESRNSLIHTYSEELAQQEQQKIKYIYYTLLKKITMQWKQKL